MNKEKYDQVINEAYVNFEKWYNEHSGKEDYTGYYVPTKEEFIRLIKTDTEFSERWGLKIEERELSLEERMVLCKEKWGYSWNRTINLEDIEWRMNNEWNTPTKLITITYKDTIIESYE